MLTPPNDTNDRYDADGGQTELKPHRDGSVVSFNIALNPSSEFDGGGTYFAGLQDALRIEQVRDGSVFYLRRECGTVPFLYMRASEPHTHAHLNTIKIQGHVVSHASNVLHGGHPITRGKRYILVGALM